jgi:hypothetical protein
MKAENSKFNTINPNNISKISVQPDNKKKKKRVKKDWSEREEKTLFILQMALGTKFSIIKNFLKNKLVNDIKNHFYSKLRTYLSIQISKLKSENFFKDIDQNTYNIKKVLTLVLSNKVPTMILNKNVIKELILNDVKKTKNKEDKNLTSSGDDGEQKKEKSLLNKKRGRPRKNTKKDVKNEESNDNITINSLNKGNVEYTNNTNNNNLNKEINE